MSPSRSSTASWAPVLAAAGDGGAADGPVVEDDLDFDGRVAPAVQDFAGVNALDAAHGWTQKQEIVVGGWSAAEDRQRPAVRGRPPAASCFRAARGPHPVMASGRKKREALARGRGTGGAPASVDTRGWKRSGEAGWARQCQGPPGNRAAWRAKCQAARETDHRNGPPGGGWGAEGREAFSGPAHRLWPGGCGVHRCFTSHPSYRGLGRRT